MIKENNFLEAFLPSITRIKDVTLNKIKLNFSDRIRKESGLYKDKKYQAIKKSMNILDQFHSILLKEEENGKFKLISGFLRFCAAIELKWEKIRAKIYTNLSEYDEVLIEILENVARIDFTSYEFYVGIGKLKEEYEKIYPGTQRGRYNRSTFKKNKHQSITAPDAVMKSKSTSFVTAHSELLGLSERALRNKTRISDAIKQNNFDNKTLNLMKKGRITQKELLKILTKLDAKEKKKNFVLEEKHKNLPKSITDERGKTNPPHPEVRLSLHKAPFNKNFIQGKEPTLKTKKEIGKFVSGINNSIRQNFLGVINKTNNKDTLNLKISKEEIKNQCKYCPKATIFEIGYQFSCTHCGRNADIIILRVICDDDFVKGNIKLRDPELKRCKNSFFKKQTLFINSH